MKKGRFFVVMILAVSMFMTSSIALATPGANILYQETNLGNGQWQYDYTFNNTSTTGEYLNSMWFDFSQEAEVTGSPLPTGWMGATVWEGTNLTTYLDPISTDSGYDIAAGSSLSGFSFTINYQAGNIPYTAYFDDHAGNISPTSGTTVLAPEPISSILFLSGGIMLAVRGYRKRKRTMSC